MGFYSAKALPCGLLFWEKALFHFVQLKTTHPWGSRRCPPTVSRQNSAGTYRQLESYFHCVIGINNLVNLSRSIPLLNSAIII